MGSEERAAAFGRLVSGGLARWYRIAASLLGDATEAEDAVHDAAVTAWQRFGSLRAEGSFEAWFDRILVNNCRDRLRRRRFGSVVDVGAVLEGRPMPGDVAADAADRDALRRAMRVLDADHLVVVVLRYETDLTVPAIAARLGLAEGTVKSRLHHALRHLRAELER
jgi:RNA polymerase sigma-70 factor, ECF subfamily